VFTTTTTRATTTDVTSRKRCNPAWALRRSRLRQRYKPHAFRTKKAGHAYPGRRGVFRKEDKAKDQQPQRAAELCAKPTARVPREGRRCAVSVGSHVAPLPIATRWRLERSSHLMDRTTASWATELGAPTWRSLETSSTLETCVCDEVVRRPADQSQPNVRAQRPGRATRPPVRCSVLFGGLAPKASTHVSVAAQLSISPACQRYRTRIQSRMSPSRSVPHALHGLVRGTTLPRRNDSPFPRA
jgi:hypothetical protein